VKGFFECPLYTGSGRSGRSNDRKIDGLMRTFIMLKSVAQILKPTINLKRYLDSQIYIKEVGKILNYYFYLTEIAISPQQFVSPPPFLPSPLKPVPIACISRTI